MSTSSPERAGCVPAPRCRLLGRWPRICGSPAVSWSRHRTPPAGIRYDFRPGAPDVGLFPHAAWARATRAAMRSLPDLELGYGDPAGLASLRETLAAGAGCHPIIVDGEGRPSALVLGYSRLTPHQLEEGIRHLATILS